MGEKVETPTALNVRTQELFLFFYNGICFNKANALIRKYKLVENLSAEDLADPENHENLYGVGTLKSRNRIID